MRMSPVKRLSNKEFLESTPSRLSHEVRNSWMGTLQVHDHDDDDDDDDDDNDDEESSHSRIV